MGPNRRAQDRERATAEAAAKAKRAEAERKAQTDAQKIVAIWNARQAGGQALWFFPTIAAAIAVPRHICEGRQHRLCHDECRPARCDRRSNLIVATLAGMPGNYPDHLCPRP
jgi:hypothetical protein